MCFVSIGMQILYKECLVNKFIVRNNKFKRLKRSHKRDKTVELIFVFIFLDILNSHLKLYIISNFIFIDFPIFFSFYYKVFIYYFLSFNLNQ